MTRKVIQIAASSSRLYALCDDGELFRFGGQTWGGGRPDPPGKPKDAVKTKRRTGAEIVKATDFDVHE
jgi:hypothetical protein